MARGLGMTALRAALGGVAGYGQDVAIRRERERLEAERARELARQEAADVRQRELDRISMLDKGYMTPEEAGAERQAGGAALSRALASAAGMLAGRGAPAFGQGIGAGDGTAIVRGMGQVGPQQRATLGGQTFVRAEPESARMRMQELAAGRERMGEERKQAQERTEKQQAEEGQVQAFMAAGATEQQARAAVRGGAKYGDLFMSPAERSREKIALAQLGIDREKAKQTDTGKPRFGEVSSLRKEFNTESRPYKTINDALRNIEALGAKTNPTPQDDQALIYQFVKAQDPTSVVRESEYANAANAIALTDRITSYAQRLQTGQKLTPTQRADMVRTARSLREEAMNQYRTLADSYESLATSFNMDPKSIVANRLDRGFTAAKEAGKPSAADALAKLRGGK
jgi:hypothetical protein